MIDVTWLHATHDVDGAALMGDRTGWLVITEAIGHDPNDHRGRDYAEWSRRGFGVVVRVNNAHDGVNGTFPAPEYYSAFARRAGNFVASSEGIAVVVIGNEFNNITEWPTVNGQKQKITAAMAAQCHRLCYEAIKSARPEVIVIAQGMAPWNNQASEPGKDWLDDLSDLAFGIRGYTDGFALHAYTHGPDAALISSDERRHDWYWHFRTYRDQIDAIGFAFGKASSDLFFAITEADQNDPWLDANNGWVQAAYREIAEWNAKNPAIIRLVAMYRSNNDDQWSFAHKEGVKAMIREAVAMGITAPSVAPAQTLGESLFMPAISKSGDKSTSTPIDRKISDDFTKRVQNNIAFVDLQPGQRGYRLIEAGYYPDGATRFGPDHHMLVEVLDANGNRQMGVPVHFYWGNGEAPVPTNKVGGPYAADYGMTSAGHSFGVWVGNDRAASDSAFGMGLGKLGNEHMGDHVTYRLVFQEAVGEQATQPPTDPPTQPPTAPVPVATRLIWPTDAPRTQRWGENAAYYQRALGIPYHNGIDHGAREGTPVRAMADGEVMFVGSDPGYGLYVRVYHPAYGIHSFIAHLKDVLVNIGDRVMQGQTIAHSGASGNTAASINADGSADTSRPAPHTHTEIRLGGRDAYAEGTFGHGNGRIDPEAAMYLINHIVGGVRAAIIDPLVAQAILAVESGGEGFADGRLKIRLEAHILEEYLDAPTFAKHFRYDPKNILKAEYRLDEKSPWIAYHERGQEGEWEAFTLASKLDKTAAMLSISMGAPQIMGFHHQDIGYPTPEAMFDAFDRGLDAQIIGFYNLLIHKGVAEAMQRRDWAAIARGYNGIGMESVYVPRLRAAYQRLGGIEA